MPKDTAESVTEGLKEKIKLTSSKIEDIILTERGSKVAKRKLSAKAILSLLDISFDIDSPITMPKGVKEGTGAIMRTIIDMLESGFTTALKEIPETGAYKKDAETFLEWITEAVPSTPGTILSDVEIADMIEEFGRDKGKVINLINLENAILLYLAGNIQKDDEIFADPIFVTMLRLYFAEYIGQLAMVEEILANLEERGYIVGRHIKTLQKKYEDAIEWKKWAKVYKTVTKNKTDSEEEKGKLLSAVKSKFKAGKLSVAGKAGGASSLILSLERAAASTYGHVEHVRMKQQAMEIGGGRGHGWILEGKHTLKIIHDYMQAKGNPRILSNDDFVEMCGLIGAEDKINLVGIQSALTQIVAQAIEEDKDVEDIILEGVSISVGEKKGKDKVLFTYFTTLLRLYYAALIMKVGVTELTLLVLGEQGMLDRYITGRLADDFNDIVIDDFYIGIVDTLTVAKHGEAAVKKWTEKGTGLA